MEIDYVHPNTISGPQWRATFMLTPDLKLLQYSLDTFGWTSPILVRKEDSTIIDGYYRHQIAYNSSDEELRKVPVVWVDCDEIDAMLMHVINNRGRGRVQARGLSQILQNIARSRKFDDNEIRLLLRMTHDEYEVLIDGTLLKARKIKEHEYSKAWVPVETGSKPAIGINIERPSTADQELIG